MSPRMIDPAGIPDFTGDFEQLREDAEALRKDGRAVRETGADVHGRFQGLSAFYTAPEAEQLFATTRPVAERADAFADRLEQVGGILDAFRARAQPLVRALERLRAEARAFVESVRDDEEWRFDGDTIDRNAELVQAVSVLQAQFWAAEREAANSITALVGGARWTAGDGTGGEGTYGLSVEDMRGLTETPWGDVLEEEHHWHEFGHWAKSFVWDGMVIDGVGGAFTAYLSLTGRLGDAAFEQSWQVTAEVLAAAAAIGVDPRNVVVQVAPIEVRTYLADAKQTAKEAAKAFVAYDQWEKDPARASGATFFNALSLVGVKGATAPLKMAAPASRAATAARHLTDAADPAGLVARSVRRVEMPAPADVTARLAGHSAVRATALPDGTHLLPDGTRLSPGDPVPGLPPGKTAVALPDGTLRLPPNHHLTPDGRLETDGGRFPARENAFDSTRLAGESDPASVRPHDLLPPEPRSKLSAESARGTDRPVPAYEDVRQALVERKLEVSSRSYSPDQGHAYATRVFAGGRPDGETVLAGHGFFDQTSGPMTVPPGTSVSFYVPHEQRIPGLNGVAVESGVYPKHGYTETYHAGETIMDYFLAPPQASAFGGFSVMENSITVPEITRLSDLLRADMGRVHWAACRESATHF
ncbi:hypothetical protein V1J52_08340 [Streptomyces sp. TRM 70351]|uniref:putative adhesin n=1 Tax=Streptomyces sp. TRM 70351 TaxID=3116552 RepID=UPI002E7B12AC|nr:hypothetical protein [Streptomyces sp. TRM 70351]MEE1928202.1 hypothetical protein [Streptomyces sp. TRM 70351]